MSNRSRLKNTSARFLRSTLHRSNSASVETASTAADFPSPFRSFLSISQFQNIFFFFYFAQLIYISLHQKNFSFCGGNVGRFPTSITGHMSTPGSATTLLTDLSIPVVTFLPTPPA
jgi:hypothetical protein